jgi:uncharacterized membrane protein YciS (DUF1049 family)
MNFFNFIVGFILGSVVVGVFYLIKSFCETNWLFDEDQ